MKYIFILNPKDTVFVDEFQRQFPTCKEYLDTRKIEYSIYNMRGVGDGIRRVRVYCDLHPDEKVCFVACGRDNIINEVAAGLVGFKDKTMAIFSRNEMGSDFVKYYPDLDFFDLRNVLSENIAPVDIIQVNDNYAINVCNFGFDSVVGATAKQLVDMGIKQPYRIGVIKALLIGRYNKIRVEVDGKPIGKKKMLLCTLANGRYVGGEFLCAPKALNNDGLMEVCYLKTMSLLSLLRLMPLYRKGKHLDDKRFVKKVIYCQTPHVTVKSEKIISLCLDGEMLPGTSFDIDVIPSAIQLRLPTAENQTK